MPVTSMRSWQRVDELKPKAYASKLHERQQALHGQSLDVDLVQSTKSQAGLVVA